MNTVVFDEPEVHEIPTPKLAPPTMSDALVRAQIVSRSGDAAIVLAIFACALVAGAVYLFMIAITPPPALGPDVLSPGEQVPDYVHH